MKLGDVEDSWNFFLFIASKLDVCKYNKLFVIVSAEWVESFQWRLFKFIFPGFVLLTDYPLNFILMEAK